MVEGLVALCALERLFSTVDCWCFIKFEAFATDLPHWPHWVFRIFGREIFWGLFESFDHQQNGYFAQNVDSD